jgi:hypothetical protein
MTYRFLLESLDGLEDEQLDMPVMACIDEEYFKCVSLDIQENRAVLDDGSPYLQVD